ncbi:MAG TPA: glycoside hydrolase family 15 protein [Steroidobacteraceae bacterium]|nr:glycoside hydrolase family 15 protein [Steroidobacteraceae bacterium]
MDLKPTVIAGTGVAFGAPGVAPTWCSSDKDYVTTALDGPRLWATVGHGIINEIYWPSTGQPQVRDLSFYLIGTHRWIDLKRQRRYRVATPKPYLPALTIAHFGEDYELLLEVLPDPLRDVLLVRYRIEGAYRLAVILAPHLGSTGRGNSAWVDDGTGFARHGANALCMAADQPLEQLSCGYVGASDGWQDLNRHGQLTWRFSSADNGTVALSAELTGSSGVLAVGFAENAFGAFMRARTALAADFDALQSQFLAQWEQWGSRLRLPRPDEGLGDLALLSAAMLKIHEDRAYPGAVVASLSVPWGNSTDSLGGYHLVWPRDATLTAFALLAANQVEDVRNILAHLIAAQRRDGHWPQNYFPDGEPYWMGIQLDETGFPVLLAAKLAELGVREPPGTAQMVRAAVEFIARSGPSSPQDRWEENPGVSPFTLAVSIAALVAGAPWLMADERDYALSLADDWNDRLEAWCYVRDTPLARAADAEGYYVRIASPDGTGHIDGHVQLCNRDGESISVATLVSLDFSYLVRLGLRSAQDRRVQDTIKVVDRILKVDTPSGAVYHRYNDDGYGEYADGRPFDGNGVGRAWPLLVGERGHLALQSGVDPIEHLHTMRNCSSPGGLLPEQVWDTAPIAAFELEPGRPSGSAMPLLWAHAEFLKLLVAREQHRPVELLQAVQRRYAPEAVAARQPPAHHWRNEVPVIQLPRDRDLLIEDRQPFSLHFGFDGWQRIDDRAARPLPFGLWAVRLTAEELTGAAELNFTRCYPRGWENVDYRVALGLAELTHALLPTE